MKTILDKINKADEIQAKKVELGKHEVELALIDDLKKSLKTFDSTVLEYDSFEKKYKSLKAEADSLVSKIDNSKKSLETIKAKYQSTIKELGINPTSSNEYMISEANIDIANSLIKKINGFNLK